MYHCERCGEDWDDVSIDQCPACGQPVVLVAEAVELPTEPPGPAESADSSGGTDSSSGPNTSEEPAGSEGPTPPPLPASPPPPSAPNASISVGPDGTAEHAPPRTSVDAHNPYQAPGELTTRSVQRNLGFNALVLVAVTVTIVISFFIFPGLPVPIAIVSVTAIARTNRAIRLLQTVEGHDPTAHTWVVAFLKSLFVTVMIAAATFVAFFMICTATFFTVMGTESQLLGGIGMAASVIVPLILFLELSRRAWPR